MAAIRPSLDPARADSSPSMVSPLGGGERVRLCNPCVPDPNIAPPQTRSDGQPFSPPGHGRSVSSVPYTQSRRGDMDIPTYRQPRESNLSAEARQIRNLAWAASQQGIQQQQTSSSYSQRDESLRPELEARSRSSTVCLSSPFPESPINHLTGRSHSRGQLGKASFTFSDQSRNSLERN